MPAINAYIRISTDEQDQKSQLEQINRWAAAQKVKINRIYTDTASGGVKWQDRALAHALQNSETGDTIVVSEISRIARSTIGVLSFLQNAAERQITIVAIQSGITLDNSIGAKIHVTILALAAEIERELLRARTVAALDARRASGLHMGRPHGTPRPSKIAARHPEIEQLLAHQVSKRAIARILNCSVTTLDAHLRRHTAAPETTTEAP